MKNLFSKMDLGLGCENLPIMIWNQVCIHVYNMDLGMSTQWPDNKPDPFPALCAPFKYFRANIFHTYFLVIICNNYVKDYNAQWNTRKNIPIK